MFVKKIKINACFLVTAEYCSVSLAWRLAVVSCNVIKRYCYPLIVLTCTSMMCDLQGLCGLYNVFMTLCNMRDTESVRGPHKNCPRAACGPRASVWTTLA